MRTKPTLYTIKMKYLKTIQRILCIQLLGAIAFSAIAQNERPKPFETSPIDALEAHEPGALLSVERSTGENELFIRQRSITYYAVADGKISDPIWTTSLNEAPGNLPLGVEPGNLTVISGVNVLCDLKTIYAQHLTIEENANLDLGNASWFISKNLTNNGNIICGESRLFFQGDEEQFIRGDKPVVLYEIVSNNKVALSIEGPGVELQHLLQVNRGDFKTAGKLVLLSNEKGSAMIGPLKNGADVKNNVTVQSYYHTLAQSWINLSSPVQGNTGADWNDDIITTGFPGADYPSYPFNNIRLYEESDPGNFEESLKGISLLNTPLINKRGYMVFANPGVILVDVHGAIFKGNQSLPVTFTKSENAESDGWNAVGNPYASAINWDSEAWTKSNISNALYKWNSEKGQYSSYVDGIGNLNGSPQINSCESFLVKANGASPILSISEDAKVISRVEETEKIVETSILRLKIHNVRGEDETTIVWRKGANLEFVDTEDALKIKSPIEVPFLASISGNGADLSINSLERTNVAMTIPLHIEVPEDAVYTFSWNGAPEFSEGSCVVFRDSFTQEVFAINEQDYINLELARGVYPGRFFLEIGPQAIAEVISPSCYGYADGSVVIRGEGDGPWNVIWSDVEGKRVRQVENVYDRDVISGLAAGYYEVVIEDNGYCSDTHANLFIPEPQQMELGVSAKAESCPQNTDGIALVSVQGGVAPYHVVWENGFVGTELNDVHAGAYLVMVTDANGCSSTEIVEVPASSDLEASFETFGNEFELKNGAVLVDFYNTSVASEEFTWSFGDGTVLRVDDNPSHLYNKAGEYEVVLEGGDVDCISRMTKTLTIKKTGESDVNLSAQIFGLLGDNGIELRFNLEYPRTLRICAWNTLGQQLISPRVAQYYNETIQLSERRYATGSLVEIVDESTGERTILKF